MMCGEIVLQKLIFFFLDCRVNLKGYQGVIEIVKEEYANGDTCVWTIMAPKGNKINITFTEFKIKHSIIRIPHYLDDNDNSLNSPHLFTRLNRFSQSRVPFRYILLYCAEFLCYVIYNLTYG